MWTFGRKIGLGFALSFVLLLAIGIVAYRSVDTLMRASYSVSRTHQVIEHVTATLSQLKDAETGQRGYILTGEDAYLEPYRAAVAAVGKVVAELRTLTADSPSQQKRVDALEPLVQEKLAELRQSIDLRRQSGDVADGGGHHQPLPLAVAVDAEPTGRQEP